MSKKIDGKWKKVVEMGIEGDGTDALLRQFGNEIEKVYPVWLVKKEMILHIQSVKESR